MSVVEAMNEFHDYYRRTKLYIPKRTAEKIEAFDKTLFDITENFMHGVEYDGDSQNPDEDTWNKVDKAMSEDVPALFEALEQEFQRLLGVPSPDE